jgi:hypothetical protein
MTENTIIVIVAITWGQAEAEVWLQEVIEPQGLRPSLLFIIVIVIIVIVIVILAEAPPADSWWPIDGSSLALVRCIGMCSTTMMAASLLSALLSLLSRRQLPANLALPTSHPPLALSRDERRWYHGRIEWVGSEAQMQKINGSPCAVAKIGGVEIGGGGGYCNNGRRE